MSNLRVLNPGYGDMKLLVVAGHKWHKGEGQVKDGEECCKS